MRKTTERYPLHAGEENAVKVFQRGGSLPIRERYAVTVPVAAAFVGISRSRIYELLKSGDLEGKIIHGRRVVVVSSLLRMAGAAPSASSQAA